MGKDDVMVNRKKVERIAKKELPHHIKIDHTIDFGIACYDSGMVEVIREIAVRDLSTGGGPVNQSKYAQKMHAIAKKISNFRKKLNEEERQFLEDFDEAFNSALAAESYDHYVEGFVRGYRYVKYYITHHTNFNGDYDYE
jgi:predicted nucleotidyltransferase